MPDLSGVQPIDYKVMYERQRRVNDEQWNFIALLIERLGGRVVFKDSDFQDAVLNGSFAIEMTPDTIHNSREYKVKRLTPR